MADTLGNISVPEIAPSGTFPLVSDFGASVERNFAVATHVFGAGNMKREQRYLLGTGARRFVFQRATCSLADLATLRDFWEARKGGYQPFTYAAPNADQTTTNVTCVFTPEPLTWQVLGSAVVNVRCVLIEVPSTAPTYTVSSTVSRFPSGGLATALLDQEQEIIPLVVMTSKESGYPAMHMSDRRCTVGGQLYQSRLLDWDGISQTIGSGSDDASFTFGNADGVMSAIAADTYLPRATIQFSLYHVGSGIKVDLWTGELTDWSAPETPPEFRVKASDGIYELRLPYPPRKVSRSCWKQFDDGLDCPYSSAGSGGDAAFCDKGYTTPKGCASHGMRRYFGGVIAEPQGVNIKDNSTGTWGFGRSTLTSSSIVDDTIYDQVIPEVYTDSPYPVKCKVAAGRDEGDFYEALALVCEGPVTFAASETVDGFGNKQFHTLDRQYNHGFPGALGLRTIPGNDPAGSTDFFSLDQSGDQVGGDPEKVFSGASTYKNNFSAGTAAIAIRRSDEKGLQLSKPTDHEITAIVTAGLQGWVWTAAGSRTQQTLTNPVWIVINMMLRARGLRHASAATAEQYFDVTAAIAMAAICDTSVAKIGGLSGTETQYKVRGALMEEKPLKDWIDEILSNCLGYYTFANGKLKIGLRANSSTVEAFTTGNVVLDSIDLPPVRASFNDLTAIFADEQYNYAANSANIYAIEHKSLIGGGSGPVSLKSQLNLMCTSASQAARIIATRLKEELGGATLAEWKAARGIKFRTTILALNVEPGMICSLTHDMVPGGAMEFRVTGWKLNKDYSIDIEGRCTTDSMYDLTAGPKPVDVLPSPVPVEQFAYPRRPAWQPGGQRASASDPILTFQDFLHGVSEEYETLADGSVQGRIVIRGLAGKNSYFDCPPPSIKGITTAATGGDLSAGNYFVQVCPYQGSSVGPPSNVLAIAITAGGAVNKISIADVTWPVCPSGSWDGYKILLGTTEAAICQNSTVVGSLPASFDVPGPLRFHSEGIQPNISFVRAKVKPVYQPGIVHVGVSSVSGTTIVCGALSGGGDAFAGRKVAVISDASDGTPGIWHFTASAYDQSTGTFTVSPDPSAAGVQAGDRLVVLTAPSGTSTTITDAKWNFGTDEVLGKVARILYGKGRGQSGVISSHTATALTIDPPMLVAPDSTSVVIIEEPAWYWQAESAPLMSFTGQFLDIAVPVDNIGGTVMLTTGIAVDKWQNEASEAVSPMRLLYFSGQAGTGGTAPPAPLVSIVSVTQSDENIRKKFEIEYEVIDPIDTLAGVTVVAEQPDGSAIVSAGQDFNYNGDPGGVGAARNGTLVAYFDPPTANEDWRIYLATWSANYANPLILHPDVSETPNQLVTVTAIAVGPPAVPTTVAGSQPGPQFREQGTSDILETLIRATITLPSGHTATGASIWISWDNGTNWEFAVNDKVGTGTSSTIDFWWPAPATTNTTVKLKAVTWSPGGWNDANSAVVSAAFTVAAGSAIAANAITDAVQIGSITYPESADGTFGWSFSIGWTNPTDPMFWLTQMRVQKWDHTGTPAPAADGEGVLRKHDEFVGPGAVTHTVAESWTIPPAGSNFRFRIYLYTVDKLGNEVLQTSAWGGTHPSYLELIPVPQGSIGAPALPSAVAGSQPSTQFRQRGTSDLLETLIRATITMPSGHSAEGISLWISFDNGTTYEEAVNDKIGTGTSSTVDFWWPAPLTTNTTVKLKAITWSQGGWNDPNSAVISSAFTVVTGSALSSSLITDAVQVGSITYPRAADGSYGWSFSASWTNPTASASPMWRLTKMYVRKYDSGGTPATDGEGALRLHDEFSQGGAVSHTVAESWTIPPDGSGYKFRIYLYTVDLLGNEVLQNAWGGAHPTYLELVPAPPSVGFVTGFSVTVAYSADGSVLNMTPTFTPPSGDANFWYCELWVKTPRGSWEVGEPEFSGTPFTFAKDFPPSTTETWDFYLVSVGRNQQKNPAGFSTASPGLTPHVTASVTVQPATGTPPALPTSIVGSHIASGQDATTKQLQVQIQAVITLPSGHTATGVSLEYFDGSIWIDAGNFAVGTGTSTTVSFWTPGPAATVTTARVRGISFSASGWNNLNSPVTSSVFTVTVGTPSSTAVTGASASALTYGRNVLGEAVWGTTFSWTNPAGNPNFFTTNATVQLVDSGGTPVSGDPRGAERRFGDRNATGSVSIVIDTNWTFPPAGSGYKYRIRLYFVNQLMAETLQACWSGGASFLDITPVEPTGGGGQEYASLVSAITAGVNTGDYGEDGGQLFNFYGTLTGPSSDSRYKGALVKACLVNTVSVSGTSVTRTSGSVFRASHVGQRLDIAGAVRTITAYSGPSNVSINTSGPNGTWTAVFVDEVREVADVPLGGAIFTGRPQPISSTTDTWRLFAISYDAAGRENTLVNGTTPAASPDLSVSRSIGSAGQEYCPVVTSVIPQSSPTAGTNVIVFEDDAGVTTWFTRGTFVEPTDPRYGGVKVFRSSNTGDIFNSIEMADVPRGAGKWAGDFQTPGAGSSLQMVFLSYDTSGRVNTYQAGVTPQFTLTTPAQAITLKLTKIDPSTLTTAPLGAAIMQGGLVTSLPALPQTPFRQFYRTSDNTGWMVGSDGNSWVAITQANGAFFAAIGTGQLAAQEILVGGGGGKPTRFTVKASDGFTTVGFIGDNAAGFQGAYFINLRVGTDINNPAILASSSGVSIQNATFSLSANSIITTINNSFLGDGFYGFACYTSIGTNAVKIMPGQITFSDSVSGSTKVFISAPSGSGAQFAMYNASAQQSLRFIMNASGLYPTVNLHNGSTLRQGVGAGTPYSFNYTKPGGATGTIEITAGWVTSVT